MDLNNLNKINTQVSALENNESDNKITEQEKAIAEALGMPDFDLKKFNPSQKKLDYDVVQIAKKLKNLDASKESLSDLQGCIDFANRLFIYGIKSEEFAEDIIKPIALHLSNLEPNSDNAKVYLQAVSVWGGLVDCPSMKNYLESKLSGEELGNIFAPFLIDKAAQASIHFATASQPAGIFANVLYEKSKFAVDFLLAANDNVASPIDGEVVETNETPWDLNKQIVEYIENCKSNEQLTIDKKGILSKMLIKDDNVAEETLAMAKDYLQSNAQGVQEYIHIHRPGFKTADGLIIKDKEDNRHTFIGAQPVDKNGRKLKPGDKVEQGDQIAKMTRNSGISNDLKLHYEVHDNKGKNIPVKNTSPKGTTLYTDNLPGLDKYAEYLIGGEA